MQKILVIGAGMATAGLLKELASKSQEFAIEVIGEESAVCYNRILLSSMLATAMKTEELSLLDDDWLAKLNVQLHSNERVTEVNTRTKHVRTTKRNQVSYDHLIFATGSNPFLPPISGIDSKQVISFRNLADLEQIEQLAHHYTEATIIGGGLLGLEAANGLSKLKLNVTVVNREQWLMPRQLDKSAAKVLQTKLEAQGIKFKLGVTPEEILQENSNVTGIMLDSGEIIKSSMVVVAAGIVPNCGLARDAKIPCGRGVIVNEFLETEIPSVYALGECCEINQQLFGLVNPIYNQAEILACTLVGEKKQPYLHKESLTQLKIAGVNVVSSGRLPFSSTSQSQLVDDESAGVYRRLVVEDSKLVGFILVGDKSYCSWFQQLVDEKSETEAIFPSMMFGEDHTTNRSSVIMS